jgi:exosortase K
VSLQRRALLERLVFLAFSLLVAWALKRHYSVATAEELRWVLEPTTALTGLVLNAEFVFRAGEGYLSRELSILVGPACAGVNFLIIAFLSLVFGFGQALDGLRRRLVGLLAALFIAYLSTLLVNTLRISASVWGAHLAARFFGLTFHSVHRLVGVTVYLAGLVVLCLTVRAVLGGRMRLLSRRLTLVMALGSYLGVTLLLPLLRGAGKSAEYWAHAAPVAALAGAFAPSPERQIARESLVEAQ